MAEKITNFNTQESIIDLNLDIVRKKRFRIDNDDNRILELNTSDLNILARLKETYPKLVNLANSAFKDLPEVDSTAENYNFLTDEATSNVIDTLKKCDAEMRELVDYIFDANVSELCVPDGSMYDPINGALRFEHIIDKLASLYESNISSEMDAISKRVKKHTDKYTR